MLTHNFDDSNELGKQGERIIRDFLESFGGIARYEDVSDNKEYQDKDIDGILWTKKGRAIPVELKTDKYTTGNIFFETVSNLKYNTPGCMYKTKAEYLYYYFPNYRRMYCIPMNEYRQWVEEHKHEFPVQRVRNENKKTKQIHYACGYLIPLEKLEEAFPHWRKFDMPYIKIA